MTRFPRPDFAALRRYSPDRRPVEIDLTDNTNLWGPHPAALEWIRNVEPAGLSRYPHVYSDDLRAVLSERYGVPADHFSTGCGSDNVLDAAFRAAAPAGGKVRYAGPTFAMVRPFSVMNSRDAEGIPWARAWKDPELLLAGHPCLVYLCRPNNPTAHVVPISWTRDVIAATEARGDDAPIVIIDEAYVEFGNESLLPEALASRRVVVARTFSKAYGLAGLRVGWGAGSLELIEELDKARGPYKVSKVAEQAAVATLRAGDDWLDDIVRKSIESRERLLGELRHRGLDPLPSATNFVFLPVPEGTATTRALELRERGVAVRPFGEELELGDGLRIGVGPWEMMERLLEALDDARSDDPSAWEAAAPAELAALIESGA